MTETERASSFSSATAVQQDAAARVAEAVRAGRDLYSARNSGVLYEAVTAAKGALTKLSCQLGGMSSDSDFAAMQTAIVGALQSSIAAITAAAPSSSKV